MDAIGVLMMGPMNSYLEQELDKRFKLFRYWTQPNQTEFLAQHADSIRAMVGSSGAGASADLIDALPKLEIVSSFSVGLDKIDLDRCKEKGVRVTNTPDVLTDDVADLAIGLMLAVLRRICQCDKYVRSGAWKLGDFRLTTKGELGETYVSFLSSYYVRTYLCTSLVAIHLRIIPYSSLELLQALGERHALFSGKRVGIIGLGRIGLAIAERAEAFDCPISYYRRSKKADTNYTYYGSVVELASNSDILVVACALTPETTHIVNREVLDALGPKGVLINIGRGPHVDEPELVSALVEGRLGGAGLDVFEKEPKVPEQLFGLENVVLLPHVASATEETRKVMADLVLGNLEAHFSSKALLTPVV
ncbi:hypothetical protein SASPL_108128 [Salvia splendens]|uniref:Glyoxylate reductase n=1 Tax=Salvia splendens TaxID=180675 RepID=A0A8X9A534_SALSN|nr:hypothetical protein SASPL_108128 [Salvia splendens]